MPAWLCSTQNASTLPPVRDRPSPLKRVPGATSTHLLSGPLAERLSKLSEMMGLTEQLSRTLDEEGELWLLFFKAAQNISCPLERARVMVACFPCERPNDTAGAALRPIPCDCLTRACPPIWPASCAISTSYAHNRR